MRGFSRRRDDRGAMAIEFLLTISMLIVVFLLTLQYAVQAHARRIATAAAEEALMAAAAYDGAPADGQQAAHRVLTGVAPGLGDASVAVERTATTVTVTVTGRVAQLIPFLPVGVRVHVQGPVERFVAPTQGSAR